MLKSTLILDTLGINYKLNSYNPYLTILRTKLFKFSSNTNVLKMSLFVIYVKVVNSFCYFIQIFYLGIISPVWLGLGVGVVDFALALGAQYRLIIVVVIAEVFYVIYVITLTIASFIVLPVSHFTNLCLVQKSFFDVPIWLPVFSYFFVMNQN